MELNLEVVSGCCATILGPMYAGKTTALIRISRDCKNKGKNVLACKPRKDNRYGNDSNFHSHDGDKEECILIDTTDDIVNHSNYLKSHVILIEEAHFFGEDIVTNVERFIEEGKYVVVSGLSGSYKRRIIGHMGDLIALSHSIHQIYAKCELCDTFTHAPFTAKIAGSHETDIEVGGKSTYIPVCNKHFIMYDK